MSFANPVETDGLRVTTPLESFVPHMLDCTVNVANPSRVANLSIAHFNLHSCNDNVGLCTPFVKNTPGLSTHSAVKTGTLSVDGVGHFVSDVSLDQGVYTVIAHARWFDVHGLKHDMARARKIVVQTVHTSDFWTTMYAAIVSLCFVAALCAFVLMRHRHKRKKLAHRLRTAGTNTPFAMPSLAEGRRWHLFLSHCWGTGQDQVHVIKKELHVLVPSLRVFLDVDDLDNFSAETLQASVRDSGVILIFLSRGYFASKNCSIEYKEAMAKKKPLMLVHESDPTHGGGPLDYLLDECPAALRPKLRREGQHILVPWLRAPEYKLVVFKHLIAFIAQHAVTEFRARRSSKSGRLELAFRRTFSKSLESKSLQEVRKTFSEEEATREEAVVLLQKIYRGRLARKQVESTHGLSAHHPAPLKLPCSIVSEGEAAVEPSTSASSALPTAKRWLREQELKTEAEVAAEVAAEMVAEVSTNASPKQKACRRVTANVVNVCRVSRASRASGASPTSPRARRFSFSSRAPSEKCFRPDSLVGHLMCDHQNDPPLTKLQVSGRGTFVLPGDEPLRLIYSTSNAGAAEVAAELSFHIVGVQCEAFVSGDDDARERARLVEAIPDLQHESLWKQSLRSMGTRPLERGLGRGASQRAVFLLVLNKSTWVSTNGTSDDRAASRLAGTVKAAASLARGAAARRKGRAEKRGESESDFRLLLVHAVDDVPTFDYFFEVTPAELVLAGLYKEKAVPWLVHDSFRAISICQLANELGARRASARERTRASARQSARESARESPRASRHGEAYPISETRRVDSPSGAAKIASSSEPAY